MVDKDYALTCMAVSYRSFLYLSLIDYFNNRVFDELAKMLWEELAEPVEEGFFGLFDHANCC